MDGWRDGWAVCEVWVDRWVEGEGKGEYRAVTSEAKKKGKICFVIYIGERFLFYL